MKQFSINYFASIIYIIVISLLVVINYSSKAVASVTNSSDIRNYLGTRTPYRFKSNKDDSKIKYPNCKHSKIWMLLRHGTRLPSAKDILGMNTILKDLKYKILMQNNHGKGPLNEEQLHWFSKWSSNISVEQEKFLTYEGQDEMILLAERMRKRFPDAIKEKYDNKSFLFKYTATQRAQQSALYFTIGLFDRKKSRDVIFEPAMKVDTTLRFYKHCDKWQKQVKKNPETYKEQRAFAVSQAMNDTFDAVAKNLGLEGVLSKEIVILMYKICGYETSWHKYYTSPWCYGFDLKSIKTLEYYHDLKHYWLDGYGHELTSVQACMILKNMFEMMGKENKTAAFLFSHSGTLLKLLTHLGLYKPQTHLRGDSVIEDRLWRASNIDCFASNIAFVLYKCDDGDKILTLHQERVIKLPMCETELCPLEHLKAYFRNTIHNCDFADMCEAV
ncbi:multiple inositol polyphosphate phosphatase 1-like [Danaus plexippus]|uniref:multiple inositol polyphosphate phosphatase 1-like n=1 Tax=Danaus plexippus TaxID=13037 RepID=UPI002AB2346E|nr:multiple inositol polyphosphate phosphatase 1-like [Danaus plexippus]